MTPAEKSLPATRGHIPAEIEPSRRVDEPARRHAPAPVEPGLEMSRSAARLGTMALSGGFTVEEDTGNRMIHALQATLDSLESRWAELAKLQQSPPLSESPTARWAARHMVDTAADADGLLTQLIAARREIPHYVEAIRLAKRSYQEQDETSGREFRKVQRLSHPGEE